jgi:hypothetical protein
LIDTWLDLKSEVIHYTYAGSPSLAYVEKARELVGDD